MAVYRPIVLVLVVRSRFHSTSVSLIHHSWQTTFQRQITYEFCLFLLCRICNAIATAFIPKSELGKSSSFPHPRLKNKEKSEWRSAPGAPFALLFPQRWSFVPNYALSKKGLQSRASGSDKTTVQPLPGCEVIDRLASISIARSRIPNSPRPLGELSAGTSAC